MKLGYNQATCKGCSSLETDLMLCEKYGIEHIELRFDMIRAYLENHSKQDLKALFDDHPVQPVTLNAIFDINFLSKTHWNQMLELFDFAHEIGQLLSVRNVLVLPTEFPEPPRMPWNQIVDDCVHVLNALADRGAGDMRIAFEPIGAVGRCVRSIAQANEVIRAVNRKDVGLAVDAYNLYQYDAFNDIDDLRLLDPKSIFIVHINDANLAIPFDRLATFDRVMPGDGSIDVAKFIEAINSTGYDGVYSIELLNLDYWKREAQDVFLDALQKTRKYI